MAPHTPQRSSRPGEPVALLDRAGAGTHRWGPRNGPPHPPQRLIAGSPRPSNGLRLRTPTRPGEPVALLDRAPAGLNHTTSSVREVASPKRPIEYPGSPV